MRKCKPLLSDMSTEMSIQGKTISLSARPVKPKPVVSTPPTPTKKLKKSKTIISGSTSKTRKLENDETTHHLMASILLNSQIWSSSKYYQFYLTMEQGNELITVNLPQITVIGFENGSFFNLTVRPPKI